METATWYGDWRVECLEPLTVKRKPVTTARLFTAFDQRRDAEDFPAWEIVHAQTVLSKPLFDPWGLAFLASMLWKSLARSNG